MNTGFCRCRCLACKIVIKDGQMGGEMKVEERNVEANAKRRKFSQGPTVGRRDPESWGRESEGHGFYQS